jgi:predicted transposase YbfD/YdcC
MKKTLIRLTINVLIATLGLQMLAGTALAGETKTTKWHSKGFACILNDDGSSACRFDVTAKNKMAHLDSFECTVRVQFTTTTWRRETAVKRIAPGKWKPFKAIAHHVPAGGIVQKIRWRCGTADGG